MKAEKTPAEASATPTPSIAETRAFISQVLRRDCSLFLTLADNKTGRRASGLKHGQLDADMWQWLMREQARGAGAFVTVNELKPGAARKAQNITAVGAWFVDLDQNGLDLEAVLNHCPLPPTAAVQTSAGGKLHLYWRASAATLEQFREIQRRLIAHFADLGADPAIKDLSRVLRLPGTLHLKGTPYLVRLVHLAGDREYTEAAMLDALADYAPAMNPAPLKQLKRELKAELKAHLAEHGTDTEQIPYDDRLKASESYIRSCAAGAGPGNRHRPGMSAAITLRANLLTPADAESLMLDYCARVGWGSAAEIRQAFGLLKWAYERTFTSRLKPRKKKALDTSRYQARATISATEATDKLTETLSELLRERAPGLNVIQVTTGAGKTWGTLEQLAGLMTLDEWPEGFKVAYCVDNHKLAKEAKDKLDALLKDLESGEKPVKIPIYKGRGWDNCPEYQAIEGMHAPGAYCKGVCPLKKQCSYYGAKREAIKAPLVIMPKQAILNDSDLLNSYAVLVIDERLDDHLVRKTPQADRKPDGTATLAGLGAEDLALARLTAEAEIAFTPEQKQQCAEYIEALAARLTGKGGVITDLMPPAAAAGLRDNKLIPDEAGGWMQSKPFWQLVTEPGAVVRVSKGRLHITARQNKLIERLKAKCIINLDATPITARLQELEPRITQIAVTQSYQLWQDTRYRGTRSGFAGCRDYWINLCNEILERRQGKRAVLYSFKKQLAEIGDGLNCPADLTHYGLSRGTNDFENHDLLILAGVHISNLDAERDTDAVLGLDDAASADTLKQLIDAEITQAVGRLRAVRRIKPAEVFVLSNEPLALDKLPRPLDDWFKINPKKAENEAMTAFGEGKINFAFNINKDENAETLTKYADTAGFSPFVPVKTKTADRVAALVSECIERFGFFAHGLIDAGHTEAKRITDYTPPGAIDPLPLPPGLSAKEYRAHLAGVLRARPSKYLHVSRDEKIKVWGDTARAAALLADPAELEAAKQAVRLAYDLNLTADLLADLKRLGLGHIDPVQEIRRLIDGDYLTDNWAVRYLHYLQDDRRFIAHRDVFTMAARGRWTADNLPVTTAEALTVTYERIAELGGGSAEPGAAEQTISYFRRRGLLQIRGADLVLTCEKTADELSQATGGPRKVKPVKHIKKAPWAPPEASGPPAGTNTLTG